MPQRTIFGSFGASPSWEPRTTPSPPVPIMPARQPGRRPKSSPVWAYAADLDENGMPPLGQKPNNKDFRVFRCKACIEKGPKKAYEYAIQGGIAHFRAHLLKHHNIVVPMTIESSATELATELTQETRERTSTMSHEIPPRESSLRQGGTQEAPLRNGNRGEKRERDEGDIEDELAIVESKVRVEEIKKRLAELEVQKLELRREQRRLKEAKRDKKRRREDETQDVEIVDKI